MLNQIDRINSGFLFSLAKVLLFLAAFSFWAASPAFAEEAGSDPKTVPCKGLKPYNNLDELLYQFYINFDSDCLFKMPAEELEKIWDTKILDKERAKPGEKLFQLREGSDFYNKPYKSEKDAFFVEIHQGVLSTGNNYFSIIMTKEYYKKYGALFPEGTLPYLLPEPRISKDSPRPHHLTAEQLKKGPAKPHKCEKYWNHGYRYYWSLPGKPHSITVEGGCVASRITVM